jgi:hypothetical protein
VTSEETETIYGTVKILEAAEAHVIKELFKPMELSTMTCFES